jgi:hypothetical protein
VSWADRRPARLVPALDAIAAAVADPRRRERTVLAILACYTVLWTIYGAIAKGSQDIHFDMGEMVAWSRDVTWSSPKHPPVGAWLAGAWFSVFPRFDWSYYLLSMTLASAALWFAWRISVRYLPADKLPVALALPMLVPFFNFHALKFNANSLMIPLWALTTWSFLRAFETRKAGWAALAGAAAAIAMLGKYWAIFLLAGLAIAAIADPRRARYFRSPAPYISIVVGFAVLAPHLAWMVASDFVSISYAVDSHHRSVSQVLLSEPSYLLGALGYIGAPVVLVALAARDGRPRLADVLSPAEADRRLILLAFALPFLLPIAAAALTRSELTSIWTMGGFTLLPVVLLSSASVRISAEWTRRIMGVAVGLPLIAVALAPAVALSIQYRAAPVQPNYQQVAQAVDGLWRDTSASPLRLVGGEGQLANAVTFYSAARPSALDVMSPQLTPWVDAARIADQGIAWVCPIAMTACVDAIEARAAAGPVGRRAEIDTVRTYLGIRGAPQRYLVVTTPPARPKP